MKLKIGFFPVMLFLSVLLLYPRFTLAATVSVILHELGHIAVARLLGIGFSECKIGLFGAGLLPSSRDYSYKDEIFLCAGGALANLLSVLAVLPVYIYIQSELLLFFILASLCLGGINLLPIRDHDGGRILYALLCLALSPDTAHRILSFVSFVCIFLLWSVSVYFLLIANSNLSLFIFSLSLFFKIFVKEN